jgi:hypothetical protein
MVAGYLNYFAMNDHRKRTRQFVAEVQKILFNESKESVDDFPSAYSQCILSRKKRLIC